MKVLDTFAVQNNNNMRIIGYIEHPTLKITVFKDGGRVSLKLENGMYEQVYKFRDGSGVENLAEATTFADAEFINEVQKTFTFMHRSKMQGHDRQMGGDENEFDEII